MLSARFAKKCLGNRKTKNIFQTTKNRHIMKTRVHRQFIETNERTVRMAKSAIPTMQKNLNNKHQILQRIQNYSQYLARLSESKFICAIKMR